MNYFALVLSEIISEYFKEIHSVQNECRLLVPALTNNVGQDVHRILLEQGYPVYFVVDEYIDKVDEGKRFLTPEALTSVRIGSFIAIVAPYQLAKIHDSVRGSGGAIRSQAFSEEWPWVPNENTSFDFYREILPRLMRHWYKEKPIKKNDVDWFTIILENIIKDLYVFQDRRIELFERILGSFSLDNNPEIASPYEKFLFHVGIPKLKLLLKDSKKYINAGIQQIRSLGNKTQNILQKQTSIRTDLYEKIDSLLSGSDLSEGYYKNLIDSVVDGISETSQGFNVLSFMGCWVDLHSENKTNKSSNYWNIANCHWLEKLFDLQQKGLDVALVNFSVDNALCLWITKNKSKNRRQPHLFTFQDSNISLIFGVDNINENDHYSIELLRRGKLVEKKNITDPSHIALNIDSELLNTNTTAINFTIVVRNIEQDQSADFPFKINVCNEKRPALVIVCNNDEFIDTVDGVIYDSDDLNSTKCEVDQSTLLYLLSFDRSDVSVINKNTDKELKLKPYEKLPSILTIEHKIDVLGEPSGIIDLDVDFSEYHAQIRLIAGDIQYGEFTIEDELRECLRNKNWVRVKKIIDIFTGKSDSPYEYLSLTDYDRERIIFASAMENVENGYRPILVDFNQLTATNFELDFSANEFITVKGQQGSSRLPLANIVSVQEALDLYIDTRTKLILSTRKNAASIYNYRHPLYAGVPLYYENMSSEIEKNIVEYLAAYYSIIRLAKDGDLEWEAMFYLLNLDSVVHYDFSGRTSESISLAGPWHPMVVAKRYMQQYSILEQAKVNLKRHECGENVKSEYLGLLSNTNSIYWLPDVATKEPKIVLKNTVNTGDPGWLLNMSKLLLTNAVDNSIPEEFKAAFQTISRIFLVDNVAKSSTGEGELATCISEYIKARPDSRYIDIGVGDYSNIDAITYLNGQLPDVANELEDKFPELSGPISIFSNSKIAFDEEFSLNPKLKIYERDPAGRFQNIRVMSKPNISFSSNNIVASLPRGTGNYSVYCKPLSATTSGRQGIPNTSIYLSEGKQDALLQFPSTSVADCFKYLLCFITNMSSETSLILEFPELVEEQFSDWVLVSGMFVDPAVFVRHVKDGILYVDHIRALWDYSVSIESNKSSYYIISSIPFDFSSELNRFNKDIDSQEALIELGKLGIAIGGSMYQTGRNSVGAIGILGTVLILKKVIVLLDTKKNSEHFVLPVDSFTDFFGKQSVNTRMRADLLYVSLSVKKNKLYIGLVGVESKYRSSNFTQEEARLSIIQATTTTRDIYDIAKAGLESGAIAERLVLSEIIMFGLHVKGSLKEGKEQVEQLNFESSVYSHIVNGNYEIVSDDNAGILVSTEEGLIGNSAETSIDNGMWIRLTKEDWPTDKNDGYSIQEIERALFKYLEKNSAYQYSELSGYSDEIENDESVVLPIDDAEEELTEDADQSDDYEKRDIHEKPIKSIMIGINNNRFPVYYDPKNEKNPTPNLHMMITGSSGQGKTAFLKYLVVKLREMNINVLLIDMKNDFATDREFCARAGLKSSYVSFDGLPFNPLIPYPQIHPETGKKFLWVSEHIQGLQDVFRKAYGLGIQQSNAVRVALEEVYSMKGIPIYGRREYPINIEYPDFSDVGNILKESNIAAYNRLSPLFSLDIFRPEYNKTTYKDLVNASIVIDLHDIASDEVKNALAQFVVMSAQSFYNAQPPTGYVRQFIVFDEAHRVLKSPYMDRLIREARSYGLGVILSSQYPSDFPNEVSASMGTRVIFSNTNDAQRVKEISKLLNYEEGGDVIANMRRFQALFDNSQYSHEFTNVISYPAYLVLSHLDEFGVIGNADEEVIQGFNQDMISATAMLKILMDMGLVINKDKKWYLRYMEKGVDEK